MNQTGTAFSYINWANFFYISPENHGRRSIDRGGWCNEERKEALIIFVQLSRQTQARKSVISSGHREPHDLPRVGSPRSGPRWRARTEQSSSERSWARERRGIGAVAHQAGVQIQQRCPGFPGAGKERQWGSQLSQRKLRISVDEGRRMGVS